jgi:HEAT repeat protein
MRPKLIAITLAALAILSITCTSARPPSDEGTDGKQAADQAGKPTFEELYGHLFSEDTKEADQARVQIGNRLDEFLPKILEMAERMDPELSSKAIELVGRFDIEDGREIILKGLDSEARSIRLAAIKSVGFLGEEQAFDKIMEYSYSNDVDIRGNCANVLGYFIDKEGVKERLRELAVDEDIRVRMPAYGGLGKAEDLEAGRIVYDGLYLESKLKAEGEPLGEMAAVIASIALQRTTDENDCKWLTEGLGPGNPLEVRYSLFETVAKHKCPNAVDILVGITRDNKETDLTRIRAGFYLAYIGDPRGYQAASDIYFAIENGLLTYEEGQFQTYETLLQQYRELLDEMELATKNK